MGIKSIAIAYTFHTSTYLHARTYAFIVAFSPSAKFMYTRISFSTLFTSNFLLSQSQHMTDIKTSVLYVGGQPSVITLDYVINAGDDNNEFRLSYYPHKLNTFSKILAECFGCRMNHQIFGDFKQLNEYLNPAFYIHVVEKI